MRVLFDQGTPAPLRRHLTGHVVSTAAEMGWSELSNGDLLRAAEQLFDALITTDQSIGYQQNLTDRVIAILVLPTTSWPRLRERVGVIAAAVDALRPGSFRSLEASDL
jgi:hypothetical protein